jgi:hypothetical protein
MMWVFTTEGFFSAVWDKYCGGNDVMIRARCKEDLCRLSKKLKGYCEESQILETPEGDYHFRLKVPKHEWSEYLAQYALNIDYPDVKEKIVPQNDSPREAAYYSVWQTLYKWQSNLKVHDSSES